MYGVRFIKHIFAVFTLNPLSLTLWTRLNILASYLSMKTKEFFLVRLFRVPLQSEKLAYPPLTLRFYAYTQFVSLFEDIFIDHLYFHPILRKKGVRIAVGGAHMGMFSAYCHWLNPTAQLVAFEADPDTFVLLAKNTQANNWKKTTCINAALSGKKGTAWFYYDSSFPGSFVSSLSKDRGLGGKKRIKTVRLSSYYGKRPFDYIKLDIEGAEYSVLQDLIRTHMLRKSHVYIIEFHHNIAKQKEHFSQAITEFTKHGFIYSLTSEKPKELFQYQDVMVYAEKK